MKKMIGVKGRTRRMSGKDCPTHPKNIVEML